MMAPANGSQIELNPNSSIKMMQHERERNLNNYTGNSSEMIRDHADDSCLKGDNISI
jgi:hypothetical protein